MSSKYYTIDDAKLAEVKNLVAKCYDDTTHVEDFIVADWPEGQEHQDWLNTASADEIAKWVIYGLRNVDFDDPE